MTSCDDKDPMPHDNRTSNRVIVPALGPDLAPYFMRAIQPQSSSFQPRYEGVLRELSERSFRA